MTAKGTPPNDPVHLELIADRYKVLREIGRGGMATVYLCEERSTGARVAVKVLRPELGSAVVVERFLREIAFASELDHPQIPKVLDSGVVGDLPFYVMNFIEGESLRARLDREKQLPLEDALHIISEVIKPTAYAHSKGIIHRDIKPANILISGNDVYVLDFGVARAIMASADESLTSTGVAVGTPAYMSPEQALADHNVDARSDIYSLGCVAYEAIGGIPPFVGATPQSVMARRFVAPPPPLHEIRELVPPPVEGAIMKALAKSPADRWQKVEQFGQALSEKTSDRFVGAQEPVVDNRKRKYTYALLTAAVALLGVFGAVTWNAKSRDLVREAQASIQDWNFDDARLTLERVVEKNPENPKAQLWLAQLMAIHGEPTTEWQRFALRAADHSTSLEPDDAKRASALAAYASSPTPDCRQFENLAGSRSGGADDFTAELALAECLASDRVVVPDSRSRTGHVFRSSHQRIASIYEGLLARYSTSGQAYAFVVPRLAKILETNKNKYRSGYLPNDRDRPFIASPELVGDTIAFFPAPMAGGGALRQNVAAVDRVVARNLDKLRQIALAWTKATPGDPAAHETLARVLESAGRISGPAPSALSEIETARSVADDLPLKSERDFLRNLELATTQIRLLLKAHRFDDAAKVAETTLGWNPPVALTDGIRQGADSLFTGMAALTGRVPRVVQMQRKDLEKGFVVRMRSGEIRELPAEIRADVASLRSYSAFGGPADSISVIARRISQNLGGLVPAAMYDEIRTNLLQGPLVSAAPSIGPELTLDLGRTQDQYSIALQAVASKNLPRARRYADSVGSLYAERAPGEVTMDAVLQYAWLRAAIGDTAQAVSFLDNSLRGLTRAPPTMLRQANIPAALVRSMLLRADLARKLNDLETASRWATAARQLWGKGDPLIAPLLH